MSRCKLDALEAIKDLPTLLSTLTVRPDAFLTNEKFFSCCAGSGQCLTENRNQSIRCDLIPRFRRLKQFMIRLSEYHFGEDPIELLHQSNEKWIKEKLRLKRFSGDSHAFIDQQVFGAVGPTWSGIFRWIWQYGRHVEFVKFTDAAKRNMMFTDQLLHVEGERLIFVYGIDHLWDQPYVDTLEYLINLAEQGRFQIFLLFQPQVERKSTGEGRKSRIFRHVEKLKTDDPLKFLTPHMQSRLQSMSSNRKMANVRKKTESSKNFDLGF